MINKQYIDLVSAYIEGTITSEQRSSLNDLVNSGEIDISDLKELEIIYQKMGSLPESQPSDEMSRSFYHMLEEEKKRQKQSFYSAVIQKIQTGFEYLFTVTRPVQVAFALALFIVGMMIGNWTTPFQDYKKQLNTLSAEVSQMREVMMLSLLDNDSVTERLKAVNISTEMQPADNKIAEALLKTLEKDPNTNVRLAAIEALLHHASQPRVREGLVNAITTQESPIIQAALADAMLMLQEKRSVDKFRQLLDRNDLDGNLRSKLQNTVTALS